MARARAGRGFRRDEFLKKGPRPPPRVRTSVAVRPSSRSRPCVLRATLHVLASTDPHRRGVGRSAGRATPNYTEL